jgi:putative membrane protein
VSIPHRRYLGVLAVSFGLWWVLLGIAPWNRVAWLLQNSLIAVGLAFLAWTHRSSPLSPTSYSLVFVFLCLLEVGAHYTYPLTPYDDWFEWLTGRPFGQLVGWERNNFDRIVHFSYGFLLAYPVREIVLRAADVRGFWSYFLPLDLVMSTSMLFELLEWATATVFGGGRQAYIGAQGDVWDTHKDMAVASLGALLAMGLSAAIHRHFQRDFAREWTNRQRVKG